MMLCCITLYHITLYYITLYHILSCHITLYLYLTLYIFSLQPRMVVQTHRRPENAAHTFLPATSAAHQIDLVNLINDFIMRLLLHGSPVNLVK